MTNNSDLVSKLTAILAQWRLAVVVVAHNIQMGKVATSDDGIQVLVGKASKLWCHPIRRATNKYNFNGVWPTKLPKPINYPNCCEYHKLLAPKDPAPIFYHVGLRQDALAAKILDREEFKRYIEN